MKRGKFMLAVCGGVAFLMIFFVLSNSPRLMAATACRGAVELVYVRGSGQVVDAKENEAGYERERDALRGNLDASVVNNRIIFTELRDGVGAGMGDYPAVPVFGSLDGIKAGGLAVISKAQLGAYKDSLDAGVALLADYINHDVPSDRCLVLVGYSQGAHVIGDALENGSLDHAKHRIVYVGLLGDPKLDTQGYGSFLEYGKYTPWYRGNAVPWLQSGLLDARRPDYLPRMSPGEKEAFTRVGSWCYDDDLVCTTNYAGGIVNNGHGKYAERAIPQLTQEIVNAIAEESGLVATPKPACAPLRQDIVFAINMSPSMRTDRQFLSRDGIAKTVNDSFSGGCDVRVGLVEFGRLGVDAVRPVMDFTGDPEVLRRTLQSYTSGYTPSFRIERADVAGGVSLALDYTWRDDAQKAIIVISDAAGDTYNLGTHNYNDTYLRHPVVSDIVKRSRDRGGVEVYAVQMDHDPMQQFTFAPNVAGFYQQIEPLVIVTAGHFGNRANCNYCTWLNRQSSFKQRLSDKPYVSAVPVRMRVGETIALTARDVYGITTGGKDWRYRWFVDCESVATGVNGGMTMTYRPARPGRCTGAVEVAQTFNYCYSGCHEGAVTRRAVTTFPIEVLPVDYTPPSLPGPVRNVTKEYRADQETLRISWEPPRNIDAVGEVAYLIKDSDGHVVGVTTATKLHITDVPRGDIPIVTVATASAYGMGDGISSRDATDITQSTPSDEPITAPDNAGLSDQGIAGAQTDSDNPPTQPREVSVIQSATVTADTNGHVQGSYVAPSSYAPLAAPLASPAAVPLSDVSKLAPRHETTAVPRLSLTIIAVSVAVLASLGIAASHGLGLRLRR